MTVNDPNSEANRLARLQAQGINNRATENLSAAVVPPVTQPAPITPMVQAPVDTNTGLSTPLAPVEQPAPIVSAPPPVAPVTAEVKTPEPVKAQVAGKTEAPIDYTQAKGREAEIGANLDAFKAKGMTPDEIMRASDYQNATPEKRALIDPYLKVQVPTASAMYNAIATKADIPDDQKTTLPFKIAQNRYTKASSYSTMTPSQLSNEMTNSRFIQGSQAYEDVKAMNPKLVQDTENLRIVNGSKQNVFTTINNPDGTSTKVNNLEKTFAEDYMDNFGEVIKNMYKIQTPEEIRAIIRTPDVQQAEDKAFEIEGKMDELDKLIEDSDKKVEESLVGSGASAQRIQLEKSAQREKLEKDKNSLLKDYTRYANKANNLITQNTTVYTTQQQQKQAQNAAMMPFLQDQYKTEQEKIKAEAALNDPATQIGATMKEFADMGIVAQGNTASKIAEFKKSGKTLPDYISGLRTQFMSKPEYKKIQELQAGQLSDAQKIASSQNFDIKKMGLEQAFQMKIAQAKNVTDNKWTKLDDGLYTNENGEIITSDELKGAKITNNSYISKPIGEEGGECGFYASRGTGMSSTPGGNSKDARIQAFSSQTPQVGGMAFFTGSGYDQTYGHISIITGVNADGTINVKESNYKNDKIVGERTVPASSVTGYYNDTPLAKSINGTGTQATGTQYSDQNINDLAYLVELQEKNPSQSAKEMKELGYSARDMANYKAGNVPLTEKQKNSSTEVMSAIKDLADPNKYEWNDAVGFLAGTPSWSGGDAANAEMAINNLVAKLTLPNLGVLKGPMSDKDIQFIKEASSKLSRNQSDDSFERNLVDAYNLSARRSGMPEIKNLSDLTNTNPSTNTVGGEMDYSKYEPR